MGSLTPKMPTLAALVLAIGCGSHAATPFTSLPPLSYFSTETPVWLSWTEAGRKKGAWDTTALFAQAGAVHGKDLLIRLFAHRHEQMFADKGLGRVTVCCEATWRWSSQTRGTTSDTFFVFVWSNAEYRLYFEVLLWLCFRNTYSIIL